MIGVDVITLARMARAVEGGGDTFLRRVYAPAERARASSSGDPLRAYAAAFAAKEAVFKALGVPWSPDGDLPNIEVGRDDTGRPTVTLTHGMARAAREKGIVGVELSISHEEDLVVAMAMALTAS
ncbi:MAG: 4'-phosphopantetheinyl transferase superfamily protein [Deltaproteobacteria bacterium]|nr:4'-phosphopantetheinyl transferase superfamily protein [Deltaproteobacteria bacterium]